MSASGSDVFFLTRDQLVPRDGNQNYDIYDARVDGGVPERRGAHSLREHRNVPERTGRSSTRVGGGKHEPRRRRQPHAAIALA
jgi:hypothetical protein